MEEVKELKRELKRRDYYILELEWKLQEKELIERKRKERAKIARSERKGKEEEKEWEVLEILDKRDLEDGTILFKLKWADGSETWEPRENLSCPDLLSEFFARERARRARRRFLN